MATKPLWTCPRCGAKLITRNLWHSCGRATLEDWFGKMGPRARQLFDAFRAMIARLGPYHVAPAQSRIAFLGRVRFAGLTAISERGMTCTFALPPPARSSRFSRVYEIVPGWWLHRLRITELAQLDRQLERWLRTSYQMMGQQGRLAEKPKRSASSVRRRGRGP